MFTCRSSNKRESHTRFKKKGRSQSKGRSKSKKRGNQCWACQKEFHYKRDCPILKKRMESVSDGEIDIVYGGFDDSNVLYIFVVKSDRE